MSLVAEKIRAVTLLFMLVVFVMPVLAAVLAVVGERRRRDAVDREDWRL